VRSRDLARRTTLPESATSARNHRARRSFDVGIAQVLHGLSDVRHQFIAVSTGNRQRKSNRAPFRFPISDFRFPVL